MTDLKQGLPYVHREVEETTGEVIPRILLINNSLIVSEVFSHLSIKVQLPTSFICLIVC